MDIPGHEAEARSRFFLGRPVSELFNVPMCHRKKPTYIVPAGIGDIAWIYSKLSSLDVEFVLAIAGLGGGLTDNGLAARALPFCRLLPKVAYATIALCDVAEIYNASEFLSMKNGHLPPSPSLLSMNWLLDHGTKLDNILPGLRTERHFEMHRPEWANEEAEVFLRDGRQAFFRAAPIAFYTSSEQYYCGQNIGVYGWVKIITSVMERFPESPIMLVGAPWDLNLMLQVKNALELIGQGKRTILVHDRDIATTLEILRRSRMLVAAVSGLSIVAEYQRVPTVHLYPKVLTEEFSLMGTWESPGMVARGDSLSLRMTDGPDAIAESIAKRFHTGVEIERTHKG